MKQNTKKQLKPILDTVIQILSKEADIQIPESIHQEYINYHGKINIDKYGYDEVIEQSKKVLFKAETPIEIKKKLLFFLGHFATNECFEILKEYINKPHLLLKHWVILAIKELQFNVENEIYEEGKDLIMSPMGGKGNKARYFIVIGSKHNRFINQAAKEIIKNDLSTVVSKTNSEIEEITFGKNYVFFTVLFSFDVDPAQVIDDLLNIVSKKKDLLKFHYCIVNTYKITKKEIRNYLQMDEVKKL